MRLELSQGHRLRTTRQTRNWSFSLGTGQARELDCCRVGQFKNRG